MVKRSNPILSRILPISALLLLTLFKFQNCAPAPELASDFVDSDMDGQVRIVDRWSEQKLSFLTSNVIVPVENSDLDLQGLCVGSETGQMISYQIIDLKENPEIIGVGKVECVMGGFELPLAQIHFSDCEARLQVRAAREDENSDFAETILVPDCADSAI